MWKIKQSILLDMIDAAQKTLPNEFICFLGGDKKKEVITEIIFFPAHTSKNAASVNEYNIPFDETLIGTLHSHPSRSKYPSNQDKRFFKKYPLNIILGAPYSLENIGFFNQNGEKVQIILE